MKIPQSVALAATKALLRVLGPDGYRDLKKLLEEDRKWVSRAVNGRLELGENFGSNLRVTFTGAAYSAQDFTHGLGRRPVFFWHYIREDLNQAPFNDPAAVPPIVYCRAADETGNWSDTNIRLRCTANCAVTNLVAELWLV